MTAFPYPADMELPSVPEYVFKARYLNLLLNMSTKEEFDRWVNEVANNPLLRVNVTDDNDPEKVLFWVPPLQYSFNTTVGGDITREVMFAEDLRNHYEAACGQHIEQTLTGVIIAGEVPAEDVAQWDVIRRRYGIIPPVPVGVKPAGNSVMELSDDW